MAFWPDPEPEPDVNKKASIHWQHSMPPHASNGGQSLCVQISRECSYPLAIYWYHSKGNWLWYYYAADSFYIIKLCSRLLVLYCRNCPKDDKFRSLIPILNHCWWLVGTPVYDFLFVIIERFSLVLTVDLLQGKTCHNSLLLGGGGSVWAKDFRGKGTSLRNIFWFLEN